MNKTPPQSNSGPICNTLGQTTQKNKILVKPVDLGLEPP